jgi:hypothetical protein
MNTSVRHYLKLAVEFNTLQRNLLKELSPLLQLKPAYVAGWHFYPTEQTVEAQIKAWPDGQYLLPIASWVEPVRGEVIYEGHVWEFGFHGIQELSFFEQQTRRDVSITFTSNGDFGLTVWTMRLFLESSNEPAGEDLPETNARLFATLVEQGLLKSISPKPLFEEAVFVLQIPK